MKSDPLVYWTWRDPARDISDFPQRTQRPVIPLTNCQRNLVASQCATRFTSEAKPPPTITRVPKKLYSNIHVYHLPTAYLLILLTCPVRGYYYLINYYPRPGQEEVYKAEVAPAPATLAPMFRPTRFCRQTCAGMRARRTIAPENAPDPLGAPWALLGTSVHGPGDNR